MRFERVESEIPLAGSPRYAGFIAGGTPEAQFKVYPAKYRGLPLGDFCYSANQWTAYRRPQGGLAIEFGKEELTPGRFACTFLLDGDGQQGALYMNRPAGGDLSPLLLPPPMLDEVMALSLLARRRGMMFHACAVQQSEQSAAVFAGFSGSGKTTTARLWAEHSGARLLGDERVAVRRRDGRLWVCATPWCSPEFKITSASVPLARLFILKHAPENQARRLGPSEAVQLLLARCYLPEWDAPGLEYTLEFLEEICSAVPCYELGFTPDRRAVEYVQQLKD